MTLIASISLPLITILEVQFSYAQTVYLKTFDVKVELSNSTVTLGEIETVKVTVHDKQNEQPVSGALVQETTIFPDQITQQQVSSITDENGQAIFKILASQPSPIGSTTPYIIAIAVAQTGYSPSFLSLSFHTLDIPFNPTTSNQISFSKTTGSISKVSPNNIFLYSEDAIKGYDLMNVTAK